MKEKSSQPGKNTSLYYSKNYFYLGLPLLGSLLGLFTPSSSEAFQISELFSESNPALRVREALDHVQKNKAIKEILAEKSINSLSITQRMIGLDHLETTKFQHYYKGLEVIGSMAFHHTGEHGVFIRNKVAKFDLNTKPSLTTQEAASLAQSTSGNLPLKSPPRLEILPSHNQDSARLIYWVELQGKNLDGNQDVLIDAHSGQIIAKLGHLYNLAPIQIYSAKDQGLKITPIEGEDPDTGKPTVSGCDLLDLKTKAQNSISRKECIDIYQGEGPATDGQCQIIDGLEGFPLGINPSACLQVVTNSKPSQQLDASSRNAAKNSKQVLTYYKQQFNRDSYDNRGAELVSIVHAGDHMANAFWTSDLNMMVYGDGDGKTMKDMTLAVDVAGHEMTHGITAQTANLLSMGESGALNEAFSDFFGKMIEGKDDWTIGRNLFIGPHAQKGIRDLANPASLTDVISDGHGEAVEKPYPSKKSEAAQVSANQTCDETNDRCWVHFNSTIPGHASYLVTQAIGKEKSERLYYTALTQNISSTDDLKSSTKAILDTCHQLSFSSDDCSKVEAVYQDMGLI